MKKRKSAFIAFLLLVLCIGGFTALSRYYKPHINVANRDAQIRIDSGKLIAAFQEDEDTANAQYLDRIVQVKGSITELDAASGNAIIVFYNKVFGSSIRCHMSPKQNKKIFGLKAGQDITVKGICTGYLMDVILIQCVIVEST